MSMLLAKVVGTPTLKQTVKAWVPHLKFDSFLRAHFRENDELLVHDPQEQCQNGDWILVRELPNPLTIKVKHEVMKIVYQEGNMIDPITKKKAVGIDFEEDVIKTGEVFDMKPLSQRDPAPYGDIGNRIKPKVKRT